MILGMNLLQIICDVFEKFWPVFQQFRNKILSGKNIVRELSVRKHFILGTFCP